MEENQNIVEMNDLWEIMARCYYQVWVSKKSDEYKKPIGFGSGFMFTMDGHLYYITADHVVNTSNEEFKLDPNIGYTASIPTNVIDQAKLLAEQVAFNINPEDQVNILRIQDDGTPVLDGRVDVFYQNLDNHLHTKFITQGLQFSEEDIRYKGLQKVMVSVDNIQQDIDVSHTFSVFGMVKCDIDKNGITIIGTSVMHMGMTFKEEKYGQYCLQVSRTDEHLDSSYWDGLSGAAVFDEVTGNVIGVALRYSATDYYLWVLPIYQVKAFVAADIDIRKK